MDSTAGVPLVSNPSLMPGGWIPMNDPFSAGFPSVIGTNADPLSKSCFM